MLVGGLGVAADTRAGMGVSRGAPADVGEPTGRAGRSWCRWDAQHLAHLGARCGHGGTGLSNMNHGLSSTSTQLRDNRDQAPPLLEIG